MNEWFEIFKTGIHTDSSGSTKEWTNTDLKQIASSYDPAKYEAPLVIGHPELDAPAYGWVQSLKVAGNKLLAKAAQIAPEFSELLKQGKFKKISIAITPSKTLRHIGFLGAAAPAVEGLKTAEFSSLITAAKVTFNEDELCFAAEPEEILFNFLGKLEEKLNLIEQRIEPLEAKAETKETEIQNAGLFSEAKVKFITLAESKTGQGCLTPAQKTLLMELANSIEHKNATGEFSKEQSLNLLTQFIELLPVQISTKHFVKKSIEPKQEALGAAAQLRNIFAAQIGIL